MKLIAAFLKLVRWPNLAFIVLTQALFYQCIMVTTGSRAGHDGAWYLTPLLFAWLSAASVLIAAAGYIINDYFDLNIDQVNKPDAIIIQKYIRRRWAIGWHLGLSAAGMVITAVVSYKIRNWVIGPLNLAAVFLLVFYSTTFKKKFLIGNIIISLLTAWVVFVLYLSELDVQRFTQDAAYHVAMTKVFQLAVLYGGFAFIISLVREVIKDMEDIRGDEKYGCRTVPIVWGIPATKVFAGVWLIVSILAVGVLTVYAVLTGWFIAAAFALAAVGLPLVKIFRRLYRAVAAPDFHAISSLIKFVMLTGILTILFFKWHL